MRKIILATGYAMRKTIPAMKNNSALAELTEKVAALGYTGKELTIRVLAIAAMQAAFVGDKEAEAHFTARAKEVAA
jgi:Na+-translocating ferredoxin:NAD+ oxidoreductase RnfG subunit